MLLELGLLYGTYSSLRAFEIYKTKKIKQKSVILKKSGKKSQKLVKIENGNEVNIDNNKKDKKYLEVSVLAIVFSLFGRVSPTAHLLGTVTIIYTIIPMLKITEKKIVKDKKIGHEFLMTTLDSLALYSNQFIGISFGMFMYHLGAKIISKTRDESKKNITNIFENEPKKVWIVKNSVEIEIDLEKVLINDIVVVETGEVIPIDGEIVNGIAMIDEHTLTGEAEPKEKEINDKVFASTIVISGRIYIKVQKRGSDTTISQITHVLEKTVNIKSFAQLNGEKWADKSALFLLSIGAISFPFLGPVGTTALLNAGFGNKIHVLGPLNVLNHLNLAYKNGILVKDGRALETLAKVDTILFDKTGTLTNEQPIVKDIYIFNNSTIEEVLTYAVAAENKITHPLARAIINKATEYNIVTPKVSDKDYKIGFGVSVKIDNKIVKVGSYRFMQTEKIKITKELEEKMDEMKEVGHSLVMVAINNKICGAIEIEPSIRHEIKEVINHLRKNGIKHIGIISGDHEAPTKKLANTLEMDSFYYDVLPEDKAKIVQKFQDDGKVVCFVGDGVNDTVAINRADVSISLKGASAVAMDLSEIILLNGTLKELSEVIDISKSLKDDLETTYNILLVPSSINSVGAFLLRFNLMFTIIFNNLGLATSLINLQKNNSKRKNKKINNLKNR